MSKQLFVPDIGGDEVTVTEIMVNVGDTIAVDQSLAIVEGDKASIEIPSPEAGVVKEISLKIGDLVSTGSALIILEQAGAAEQPAASAEAAPEAKAEPVAQAAAAPAASASVAYAIPDIGGDEVVVTEVMINVGDTIAVDDNILAVEGDKASMEIPASAAGVVKEVFVKVGDKVSTGAPMMVLEQAGAAPAATPAASAPEAAPVAAHAPVAQAATPSTAPAASQTDVTASAKFAHATPVIRRLAREFGVNLDLVKPTGPKNRVLKQDVQNYVKNLVAQVTTGGAVSGSGVGIDLLPWPKVDFSKFGPTEEVELGKIKKISGANLHRNWVVIPHITIFEKADMTDLEAYRKQQNAIADKQQLGYKITPLVFIMKAVAQGLAKFPNMNSSITADAQRLTLKKYFNIGIAVDTPNGLVVPVIKDVDKKGFIELSNELVEISKKARAGKLTGADMQGGCFTITSLGGFGSIGFNPIVNAPEVGILGVSKSAMEPVWNGKEFEPRLMLPMSVAVDHRVIDGVEATKFLVYVKNLISDIRGLLL